MLSVTVRGNTCVTLRFAKAEPMPGAPEETPLVLVFDGKLPEAPGPDWERDRRQYFQAGAESLVDALQEHAPGGLVDAVFAELAKRRASLLIVPAQPRPAAPPLAKRLLGALFRVQAPPLPREGR